MRQDATNRVVTKPPILVTTAVDAFGEADRMRIAALVGELRSVLQDQNRSVARIAAAAGRRKMTIEELTFFNPWVVITHPLATGVDL